MRSLPGSRSCSSTSHDPIHLRQEFARDRPPAGINDHPDPAHVGIIALRGLAQSQ